MATASDIVSSNYARFDEIWNNAQGALDTLKAASRNSSSPASYTPQTLQFDPGPPSAIQLANFPNLGAILANIDSYIQRLSSVTPPVFPNDPNFTMLNHQVWEDQFAEQIKAGLSGYLTTMGIPDVTFQNAIFNKDYERNLQVLNDVFDLADAKTGAKGFSYPNDWGNSLKLDAQNKYQFERAEVSRNVSKLVTEWARENYAMAIKEGIALETFHADFTYKYCTAFVSIFKDLVMALVERYKAQVEVLVAPIDALRKELDAAIEYNKLDVDVKKTKEALVQSRAEIQIKEALSKYETDAKVVISEFQQQLDGIKQAANAAASIAQAAASSTIGLLR